MGIDYAIGSAEEAIMLDNRSQAFCSSNNRWYSNRATSQHYPMMNTVNTLDGEVSPLGLAPASLSPGFGSFEENLPLSRASFPTDTFDDPYRPTTDNGYGTCQSPGLDSLYSNPRNIGTPNSFVTDCQIDSPRERLFSTSSSTYTYSPYNAHEERTCTPVLQRQRSSEMVEQFFNNSECLSACNDDNGLLDNASQGFSTHLAANNEPAVANVFDDSGLMYMTGYVDIVELPGLTKCQGSPQTDSTQASTNGNENVNTTVCSSTSTPACVYSTTECTGLQTSTFPNCQVSLPRQISTLSELINETIATNSQDATIVEDYVRSFEENTYTTVNVAVLSTDAETNVVEAQCLSQNSKNSAVHPVNITTPKARSEDEVVSARREKNNAACRASRKRRKDKKTEMEQSIAVLEADNASLATKIEYLEVECKRVKQELVARMGNASR